MTTPFILYRFFDRDDKLLYVGTTSNPARRFEKHRGGKSWWSTVARMELEHYPDRAALAAAEKKAIEADRPLYNVRMNGQTPSLASPANPEKLPRVLLVGGVYALGLRDGTCPVGIVLEGDEDGVVLALYDWLSGFFGSSEDEWVAIEQVVRWRRADLLSESRKRDEGWDPKLTVYGMDPLGDFQTKWLERGE